jgi:hypothetical protein
MVESVKAQNEVWVNTTPATVFVRKLDHRGELTKNEQVNSGRRFNITTEERKLNMDAAANETLCVFRNGILSPVGLIGEDLEVVLSASGHSSSSNIRRPMPKTSSCSTSGLGRTETRTATCSGRIASPTGRRRACSCIARLPPKCWGARSVAMSTSTISTTFHGITDRRTFWCFLPRCTFPTMRADQKPG